MTAPRIYAELDDQAYRAMPGLSGSAIGDLLKSPAVYRHKMDNPTPATPAMALGTLAHSLILDQPASAVVAPFADFRTKEAREWRDAQTLDVVTQDVWDTADQMAQAVSRNLDAVSLLQRKGWAEVPLTWSVGDTPCKGKLDWLPDAGPVVDVKTTANIEDFSKHVGTYAYHAQVMHYRRGALAHGYGADERPIFIVAESVAPYRVAVYQLSEADAAQGEAMCEEAYRRYADCMAVNVWPSGLPEGITETDIPRWAYRQWDALLTPDLSTYETALSNAFGGSND